MQKNIFIKIIGIFLFIMIFSFSFCFASENVNIDENEKENDEIEELLLVIDECTDEIKNELKQIYKTLNELSKTEEYEKYPAIRLNIDTPFFGLSSMMDQKLKIKNDVSTVDYAKGYSIKDVVNNMSIKLPDFKVGNIVVSTRNVKFDENISVEDAKSSILKLVQYISQAKNTNELLNKRINNIFEGYIPKEKSEKIANLNNRLEDISNNMISKDDDILTVRLLSNDEISKNLADKYYEINNNVYKLEDSLSDVLLDSSEIENIEKSIINLELESIDYLKQVNEEKEKITYDMDISMLLNNAKLILENKKATLDDYVKNSSTIAKWSLAQTPNDNTIGNSNLEIKKYDVTSMYIIDYEQNLLNTLDDKIKYYIPENLDQDFDTKKEISNDEKKSLLHDVIKLYNDFISKENKFYLDNLNYILKDTTYKLAKLPEYTDSKTIKDVKYIYISLPEEIDNLLDEYNTKSILQTERLKDNLYERLIKIVESNIGVTIEYNKFNLS